MTRDDARLEDLGYKPELKRNFSKFETFGVAFSIMGVVPSIASTIFYNLPYGGPVGMIWGWALAASLIATVGLAMGDLASSMPTSGGLYYWTHRLSPPKYRNFLSWMVGYNSFLGNVAAISSLAWGCQGIFFAAGTMANENFAPSVGAQFGLYCGILIFCAFYCAYGTTVFARVQTPATILNVSLALATIIGLPIARRGNLNTAAFTFGGFVNLSGWGNGMAFLLSMIAPVWTIGSFDCAVSISEEASNAAIAVPAAIIGSIASAGILGAIYLAIIALCMGTDVEGINDSAIGQPLAVIYQMGFGTKGAIAIWAFIAISQVSMTSSLILPSSRQAFAFSRDGALPFSKYWYHVDSWSGTPVRTVWLVTFCAMPLGLLAFADPVDLAAINAIFCLNIMGLYVAYGIPIGARVLWGKSLLKPGPWYLGKFSYPIACIAATWMCFAIVLFCFPGEPNPDGATMNYAIVVSAAVWVFAGGYYFMPKIGGKTFFT
ncbi:amino acid transporter [Cutaneotrichosporon oleaginosum]|uniref:Amino acid transporter n=2 Tax=Cutaneotrichosporon oleaginosum TaxID=879819 RepID=A0A0J0XMZ1_9TREE|nr:amino acid transporter [Cutaneotrichosporon oleaginosum]KLT42467.1 amino acid transporter [Cutaneotrichosporon oleaginosum]